MVFKYIQSILLISEQPLSQSNKGTCTFNGVFNTPLGNTKPCVDTPCMTCIFREGTSLKEIGVITHEHTSDNPK